MERIINAIFSVKDSSFNYLVLAKLYVVDNTKMEWDLEDGIFFLKQNIWKRLK